MIKNLGRGRGFKVVARASILGNNEVTRSIGARMIEILVLLVTHGIFTVEEVLDAFHIEPRNLSLERRQGRRIKELEAQINLMSKDNQKVQFFKDKIDKYENKIRLVADILEIEAEEEKETEKTED